MTIEIKGWIREGSFGDSDDIVWVDDDDHRNRIPLTEALDCIWNRKVTVHYYITNKACTKEEAVEQFLYTLIGLADVEFTARYSDITGYLWTDENLMIGGHDLLEELRSEVGNYLLLEIEVHAS